LERSIGLAYLPEGHVLPYVSSGQLVRVLWCAPFSGYHLYYPSRRQPSPAFSLIVDALRYQPSPAFSLIVDALRYGGK
jgi:DNA-binding transcriptional LysR family regulator